MERRGHGLVSESRTLRADAVPLLRKSGLRLPALSLGLWHNFGHVNALESQRAILRKAFDLGITHFDLANNYGPPPGSAEENFGRLLREDFAAYRDELIISTKAGYDMWPGPYGSGGSRKYLLASLDQSLKRMGLEYVDIFTLIASMKIRRWKKPPLRWLMRYKAVRRCMSGSPLTRQSGRKNGRVAARVENSAVNSSTFVQFTEPLGG